LDCTTLCTDELASDSSDVRGMVTGERSRFASHSLLA